MRAALTGLAGTLPNGSRSPLNGAAAVPGILPTELGRANTGSGDRRGPWAGRKQRVARCVDGKRTFGEVWPSGLLARGRWSLLPGQELLA